MTDNVVPLFKSTETSTTYIDDDQISLPPAPPAREPTEHEQALQFMIEYLQTEGGQLKHFIFIGEKNQYGEDETPFPIIHGPIEKKDFSLAIHVLSAHFNSRLMD